MRLAITFLLYYQHMASKKSDSTRKELGNKLKEARKKVGLTQAEVAEVNTNYYARIERGEENPSFEMSYVIHMYHES